MTKRTLIDRIFNRTIPEEKPRSSRRGQIITRIIEQSTNRSRKDVASWKRALRMAENRENPNRTKLYDLYEDLMLDNHLKNLSKRVYRMVAKNKFQIKTNDEIDEDLSKLLKGQWFFDSIRHYVYSRFYGHSLIEYEVVDGKIRCYLIPRKNVIPEIGGFKDDVSDSRVTIYRGDRYFEQYLVEVGEPYNLGDLSAVGPNVLFKKNAMVAWSEYTEIFGMPLRIGKTNSRNDSDLDRVQDMLVGMAKGGWAVIDSDEEIQFVESKRGDAFNVYDKLIERTNSEISKLILGETLTTDVGANGSRAQSEVHSEVSDEVADELQKWILGILNEKLLPVLANLGYPVQNSEIEILKDNETSLEEDKWLFENFDIDPQHFADKYSISIEGVKEKFGGLPFREKKKENTSENYLIDMHRDIAEMYSHNHPH